MSHYSLGPGWWIASDGKWYAPEQHPDYCPPACTSPAVPIEQPLATVEFAPPNGGLQPSGGIGHPVHQAPSEFGDQSTRPRSGWSWGATDQIGALPTSPHAPKFSFPAPVSSGRWGSSTSKSNSNSTARKIRLGFAIGSGVVVIIVATLIVAGHLSGRLTGEVPPPSASTPAWQGSGFSIKFPTSPRVLNLSPDGNQEKVWADGGVSPTHAAYAVMDLNMANGGSIPNSTANAEQVGQSSLQALLRQPNMTTSAAVSDIQVGSLSGVSFAVSGPATSVLRGSQIDADLSGIGNSPVVLSAVTVPDGDTLWVAMAIGVGTSMTDIPGGQVFLSSFSISS